MATHKFISGWKLPILAVFALSMALYSVLSRPEAVARTPAVMPPSAQYDQTVAGIGVIEPKSELIAVGVELPGVVRNVWAKVGDEVEKGTPLFVLDQREVDAEIKTLEASLSSARVQAADANAQYATVASFSDGLAVAKDEVNRRKYAKTLAYARVEEIEAQLDRARTNKERLTVYAPITGRVLEVNVRPGEYAAAGILAEPLIRMGDVSTLHVRVEIDEENASKVSADAQAKAFRRGDTKTAIPLHFVRFEPYVQPKTSVAVVNQRVDTRVLQVIYALDAGAPPETFVGQQMDVFIEASAQAQPAPMTATPPAGQTVTQPQGEAPGVVVTPAEPPAQQ